MTVPWELRCAGCSRAAPDGPPDYCPDCGYPFLAHRDDANVAGLFDGRVTDLWKYAPLYPVKQVPERLRLGEGGTPLVPAGLLGAEIGIRDLWCKLDHLNPSGSFKDRSVAVGMAWALEAGAKAVLCASSGNAAGSTATYAARAGLPAVIFVPAGAPTPKLALALAHGAHVFRVPGDFSRAFNLARQAARALGWVNLSTTYVNGWAVEGTKSVAYELYEQAGGVPDWVVVPVSAGPLLYGVWKGFRELQRFGLIDRLPRLAAAQPEGCAPIARAYADGRDTVSRWENVQTMVSGLNDPLDGYEADGTVTLRAVQATNGVALALPDSAILAAGKLLAQREGIFVEPAAATAVAGASALRRNGRIGPGERVVCLLTGHGLKQPVATGEVLATVRSMGFQVSNTHLPGGHPHAR